MSSEVIRKSSIYDYVLIVLLTLTPFIVFLGDNAAQIEFFSFSYFIFTIIYCIFFLVISAIIGIIFRQKKISLLIFSSFLSFLQFYFYNIEQSLAQFFDLKVQTYLSFLLIIVMGVFFVKITKKELIRNFFIILLLLNITISIFKFITDVSTFILDLGENNNSTIFLLEESTKKEDKKKKIFYIIPDGLASPKVLLEFAGIGLEESIQSLEEIGFSVLEHGYSSYNLTHLSLAALFDMKYPVIDNSPEYKDRKNFYPNIRERNPQLLSFFKKKGYDFIIIPPSWGGCPKNRNFVCLIPGDNGWLSELLQDYSVFTLLQHSILFDLVNISNMSIDVDDSAVTAMNKINSNPELWNDNSTFTLIHMLMPHSPQRNEDCSILNYNNLPSKEEYKSSSICALNRLKDLSIAIIENHPDSIIIIQSDHGVRIDDREMDNFQNLSKKYIDSLMSNFTAVRGCKDGTFIDHNQVSIIKNIYNSCLLYEDLVGEGEEQSYFGFYENHKDYGRVYMVER